MKLEFRVGKIGLILVLIVFPAIMIGCEDGKAHYTCYGGVKVDTREQCDFSTLDVQAEDCELEMIYDSGIIVTLSVEAMPAFGYFISEGNENYKYVNTEFYGLRNGKEFYRTNLFNTEKKERIQFFIDFQGKIYKPTNCQTKKDTFNRIRNDTNKK